MLRIRTMFCILVCDFFTYHVAPPTGQWETDRLVCSQLDTKDDTKASEESSGEGGRSSYD